MTCESLDIIQCLIISELPSIELIAMQRYRETLDNFLSMYPAEAAS